jgi:NAD(P)-dependent dehydrogenase (short-subunit alcohol dehydrogenase family)
MSGFIVADRLAFISGGASGIGRAIAHAIVAKGGRVAIGDVDLDRAQAVAASLGDRARAYGCDVRDHAAVEALADTIETDLGPVDIAFANAGIALNGPVLDADPAAVDRIIAVNVKGVWAVASIFGRRMIARGGGYLCLTGSEHSFGLPHPGSGIYTATKHAVIGIADALRSELPDGVGISVLCPGLVSTELYDDGRYDTQLSDDPGLDFRRALLAHGVDPTVVAAKAIAGVERGDFIIPTHGHSRAIADRRHEDIAAGFAVHAPRMEDAEKYDVNLVAAAMMAQLHEGAAP